jgi:hypothetical protein
MTTTSDEKVRTFDVDDAEHVAFRDSIAALLPDVNSGEELHPDPVRRADA